MRIFLTLNSYEVPTEAEGEADLDTAVDDKVEKQFSCDVCGKSFDLVAKLAGHTLIYHDSVGMEEALKGKCPICSKKRNHLFSHVWMHFQVCRSQRFKCNIRKDVLDTHKA